jgi:hypothetical protein
MSGAHDFIALVMAGTVMVGVYALIVIVFDAEARRLIQGLLVDVDHLRRGLDSTG